MTHIEDLNLSDFIKAVRNLGNMVATEKSDGANCWLGIDDEGKLFTTREGKSNKAPRFYDSKEYPTFAAYNGFRSAMAALQAKEQEIRLVMQPGQVVEFELLYGRQPNAITYGLENKSYIVFLRSIGSTPKAIANQLGTTLGGQTVTVTVPIVDTTDGKTLTVDDQQVTYQFSNVQRIDPAKLKDVNLEKQISELEEYLKQPAGIEGLETTNFELITNSLGSIKADVRPQAKELKNQVLAKVMTDFKLPIKKELLQNYVSKIKPALSAMDLTTDEDVGIEGVVLTDPTTGDMIKLVDKDAFTTINAFNHAVRNQISGLVKTLDSTAPLESRGGIIGNMKIHIADLLGNDNLARGGEAKKIFAQAGGATPEERIKNFSANLEISDYLGVKRKVLSLIHQAAKDLDALLTDFTEHKDEFQLKLKSGKVIGLSAEIVKRTLLVFAESRKQLEELFEKVKKAGSIAQLIATLFGRAAVDADPEKIKESLIQRIISEKMHDTTDTLYHGKDAYTLLNCYFATILLGIYIFQLHDQKGITQLKDRSNYMMTKYWRTMSPVNFWGYPIWRASSAAVKKLIGNKAAGEIFKVARHVTPAQWRYLHQDLSFGKDGPINWQDHWIVLNRLQAFPGMAVGRINSLIKGVFGFSKLDHDGQIKLTNALFFYASQFVPNSTLLIHLKSASTDLLIDPIETNQEIELPEMKLLLSINAITEDENGAVDASAPQVDIATHTKDVASDAPTDVSKHFNIVKRKRNPKINRLKFKKPEASNKE